MSRTTRIIITLVCTFGAGFVGSLFVGGQVGTWYTTLAKPPLTPPDAAFPIVWTILYVLMAAAALIKWLKHGEHSAGWMRFYFIQLMLNAGWTIFFFGYHAVLLSLFDILVLDTIVLGLILFAHEEEHHSTVYLLLPYLAWLLFATYLTIGIWTLN